MVFSLPGLSWEGIGGRACGSRRAGGITEGKEMLTIRNLTKTVGARTLFSEASMTINYGERVALVGPNGAGKSTLFGLVLGDDVPDSGEVARISRSRLNLFWIGLPSTKPQM